MLLTVATTPHQDGRAVVLTRDELHAVAVALSETYRYGHRCPHATVYPTAGGRGHAELLARLTFDQAAPELMLDRLADHARHTLFMHGRQAVTVTAAAAPAHLVTELADELGVTCQVADRDWRVHAWVRFVRQVETGSPYDARPTLYRCGQQLDLYQSGRAGEPIDRSTWRTSFDVDRMHFIPADAVQIVEVIDETPARAGQQVETPSARHARRWALCRALLAAAEADPSTALADRIALYRYRKSITHDLDGRLRELYGHLIPGRRGGPMPVAERAEILRSVAELVEQVVIGTDEQDVAARATAAELRRAAGAVAADVEALKVACSRAAEAMRRALLADAFRCCYDSGLPAGVTEADLAAAADRLIAARHAGG